MNCGHVGKHAVTIQKHEKRIAELEESITHILERLHQLEEKERERARIEFQREQALDFINSEGLGAE
jgi:hypothetical protein